MTNASTGAAARGGASPAPPAAREPREAREATREPGARRPAAHDPRVADFERALRERSPDEPAAGDAAVAACAERAGRPFELPGRGAFGGNGGGGNDDKPAAPAAADAAGPGTPPPSPAAATSDALAVPPSARGIVEPLPAALRLELMAPTPAPGSEAARSFEVSLREPLGAAVTLNAVAPAAQAGAAARWTLSIGAPALNPAELRRNLGRLEERLRARALSHDPVRIESEDPS